MSEIKTLTHGNGRRLALRRRPGRGATLVFLPGYISDMEGGKATALDAWAAEQGRATVRFDYGGCGASGGAFEAQSLDDWLADVAAVIDEAVEGPAVLVGSSMGGWLMLLAALERPEWVAGLVGIAAAPDFTSWGFSDAEKRTIAATGRLEQPSPYGEQPYVTTRLFWESGERRLLLGGPIGIDCPVRLIHGDADGEVPLDVVLTIVRQLRSADVQLNILKGGGHRLSEPHEIEAILRTVAALLEPIP